MESLSRLWLLENIQNRTEKQQNADCQMNSFFPIKRLNLRCDSLLCTHRWLTSPVTKVISAGWNGRHWSYHVGKFQLLLILLTTKHQHRVAQLVQKKETKQKSNDLPQPGLTKSCMNNSHFQTHTLIFACASTTSTRECLKITFNLDFFL